MDETSADMKREEAERPENEQNDSECPKHEESPRIGGWPELTPLAYVAAEMSNSRTELRHDGGEDVTNHRDGVRADPQARAAVDT